MKVDLFDFELPEDRIALRPAEPRDSARLLHVPPGDAPFADRIVRDLPDILKSGDILVVNDWSEWESVIQPELLKRNAIIIPQKSTFELQDKIYVYVVDKNNVVKSRLIHIGQKLSNIYVVESGLSADDKIVYEGIQSVKENEAIQTTFITANAALSNK